MKKSVFLLSLLLLAAGCVSKPQPRVGVCVPTLNADYVEELGHEFRRELDQRGIETVIRDADLAPARQVEQIKNFTKDYQEGKLAALVIMPINTKEVVNALAEAQATQVPIFTISSGLPPGCKVKPLSDFGVKDVAAGRMAAKMLMSATQNKKGKVMIVSSSYLEVCKERVKGFSDELAAAHSPAELVWLEISTSRQDIVDKVYDMLRKDAGPREFIGIYASLDPAMLASMTARNLNGREADIRIVGMGGSGASRNAVRDGLIFGTIEHSTQDLAAKSAAAVGEYIANGTTPPATIAIDAVAFTAADAKAQQEKHLKKEAESAAKLEALRKEAACKCRDGQSKCVCKECKCNVKKAEKSAARTVKEPEVK